jgi:hypothetical protein
MIKPNDEQELASRSRVTRVESDDVGLEIGQWWWVKVSKGEADESDRTKGRALMCLMHLGSNYALFSTPPKQYSGGEIRIHFNDIAKCCTRELDWKRVIEANVKRHQDAAMTLMDKVRSICAELGVSPELAELQGGDETAALVRVSSNLPVKDYKRALELARKTTLPELFKKIGEEHEEQVRWMKAAILPLRARTGGEERIIKRLEDRVFNVELYAGLVEEVEEIRGGKAASTNERIRLMQRRHYMDEESLLAYTAGGIDFNNVGDFDEWMAEPANADRILPFPRCIVAFRVRRKKKDYDPDDYGGGIGAHIRIAQKLRADESTFLYMRNGEKLFRLRTGVKFRSKLFPDLDAAHIGDGSVLWATKDSNYYDDEGEKLDERQEWTIVTDHQLQGMKEDAAREKAAFPEILKTERAKKIANGEKIDERAFVDHMKWLHLRDVDDWKKFEKVTPENVYYDDIMEEVADLAAQHNRLAIVLQGLLDRSPVFQPHPKWELWTAEGFESAIALVYDESRALSPGEKPDFEAFRARLNASFRTGSISVGQQTAWLAREAEKENERRSNSWSYKSSDSVGKYWKPYGNEGPGEVAPVEHFSKVHGCRFTWTRDRLHGTYRHEYGDPIGCRFSAPTSVLLNVSAYTPGDYLRFFADPRTRADYLKWAPLLLAAEDWHGSKEGKEHAAKRAEKKEKQR